MSELVSLVRYMLHKIHILKYIILSTSYNPICTVSRNIAYGVSFVKKESRFCTSLSDRKSTHLQPYIFIRKCFGCSYKMLARDYKVVLVIICG